MKVELILSIFFLHFNVCHGAKVTPVDWWFATMRGQDVLTGEIGGCYSAAETDHEPQPEYRLYKKGSDVLFKYVTQTVWTFHIDGFLDPELFHYENINFVLEGVDTIATVEWNNNKLGSISSMFFPHFYSIKKLYYVSLTPVPNREFKETVLEPDTKSLGHQFYSSTAHIEEYNLFNLVFPRIILEAQSRYASYGKKTKLYPECPPKSYNGICNIFMLRKMQSSFGSVIGPQLPSLGVWRPAHIEGYNETMFRDISVNIEEETENWSVNLSVYFANNTRGFLTGVVQISLLDTETRDAVVIEENNENEFVFRKTIRIPKEKVELWWPIGFGKQVLYDLRIKFSRGKREFIKRSLRVGFRKVELIQEKIGNGESFYFKVNGKPIFMKGAVLAPIDLRPEVAQDTEKIKKLFSIAIQHNMNMIRVWGGGLYQSPTFYELADEMGLMIWQDFMFTDLSYPTDSNNLKSVQKEIRYQVRRLSNHPSVMIFCGNDEGEIALAENRYQQNQSKTVKHDYLKLFDETIKKEVRKATDGNPIYLSSTPSNGKVSEGSISTNPNDPLFGDVHVFDTVNDPFDHNTYPIPRFVSAYGLQSLPKIESFLKDSANYSDLDFNEKFLRSRQHLPNGYAIMKSIIGHQKQMGNSNNTVQYARTFSYYSQVIQAYAMRIQTEKYRSYRSITTKKGFGNTMGALYWHLNDVWTAPTWSGMDYFGEWKMLQYYVPLFFSPVIVTGQLSTNELLVTKLDIFVVSDIDNVEDAEVKVKVGNWNGLGISHVTAFTVQVDAGSSKLVHTIDDLRLFLSERNCTRKDCFVYLTIEKEGQPIAPDNFILLSPIKNSNFGDPGLEVHLRKLPYEEIYEITIKTERNAVFVWLDAHEIDGYFSENGFLQITRFKKVFFYSRIVTSENQLREILTVIHINDKSLI